MSLPSRSWGRKTVLCLSQLATHLDGAWFWDPPHPRPHSDPLAWGPQAQSSCPHHGLPKFPSSTQDPSLLSPCRLRVGLGAGSLWGELPEVRQGHFCSTTGSTMVPGYSTSSVCAQLRGPLGNGWMGEGGPWGLGRGQEVPGLEARPEPSPGSPKSRSCRRGLDAQCVP